MWGLNFAVVALSGNMARGCQSDRADRRHASENEAGSRTTYGSALRRFLDGRDGTKGLAKAIDDPLQQLARRPRGGSAAKGLLYAIRMLENLHLLPSTDLHRHWMQVEGIRRISAPNAAPRVFSETADLEQLGTSRDHWAGSACSSSPSVQWSTECASPTPTQPASITCPGRLRPKVTAG